MRLEALALSIRSGGPQRSWRKWQPCTAREARAHLARSIYQGQPETWLVDQLLKGRTLEIGTGRLRHQLRGYEPSGRI
jgi:hypothetical protein